MGQKELCRVDYTQHHAVWYPLGRLLHRITLHHTLFFLGGRFTLLSPRRKVAASV